MPVTIRSLLTHWKDSTRLIVGGEGAGSPTIDEPLLWVHSSELADPTPFLDAGHLLLTDGSQFQDRAHETNFYDEYVARLAEHGIAGLGFGTSLIFSEVPPEVEVACRRHGLPLFLITDLTPFLAFARFVADELAREQTAHIRWSLDAQRAIARAAMRPDGLTSILTELERQLNCSALLFDAVGTCIRTPADQLNTKVDNRIRQAVHAALERGARSASHITIGDQEFMLQTIGHNKRLDGVMVLGGLEWPDPGANDLVNSVIALASLALTQTRALDKAHHHLRAGLFEQLLTGDRELATRTATSVWGGLPASPLTVLAAPRPDNSDFLLDALAGEAAEHRGRVFFTEREDRILVLTEATPPEGLLRLLAHRGITIGTSTGLTYETLQRGVAEAGRALRHAVETGQSNVAFQQFLDRGVLGLLRQEQVGLVARSILQILHNHDTDKGSDLLTTVRVWVDNECAWDTTARELGIHRHTLRNRIHLAGRLLDLDLDVLRDRLELWAAVQLMTED